jgi:pyruvate/2-oxoglutarate dehydrogenase complex dihydrolipoamide acyltransferase (E2) component
MPDATTAVEPSCGATAQRFGREGVRDRAQARLCLAYDHRPVDGADAARFLTDLAHELETAHLLGGAA